jgi:hypothetical protein
MKRALAPWTHDVVVEISDYQEHPKTIGYGCLNDSSPLQVDCDGTRLFCSRCDYIQEWVHGHIANGRGRIGIWERDRQVKWLIAYWQDHGGVGRHLHEWLGLTVEQYDDYARTGALPVGYQPPRRWNRHPW